MIRWEDHEITRIALQGETRRESHVEDQHGDRMVTLNCIDTERIADEGIGLGSVAGC